MIFKKKTMIDEIKDEIKDLTDVKISYNNDEVIILKNDNTEIKDLEKIANIKAIAEKNNFKEVV